ncbi:MAG TPA: GspH/FimT family pseudopilin [Rhodanobacteraceae bacterium]
MNHIGATYAIPRTSRRRAGGVCRARGFTLVELMITIFVAAILITIAVPSFQHVIASTRLTTTSNSLVNALQVARMQAIKRNADAQFCGNNANDNGTATTLGAACGTQGGAVYVLDTTTAGATAAVQAHAAPAITGGTEHLHGNITPLVFDATGVAHAIGSTAPFAGTIADVCTTTLSSNNHRVITMTTGTIIATASTSAGSCP